MGSFFRRVPELQTVKFKLSNGSGCRKEDVMVLGNGVVIVIQDKDAYCPRWGVWGANERGSRSDIVSGENKNKGFHVQEFHIRETFFPQM